jgi:tetratricopeptide (TPR) repeat protein
LPGEDALLAAEAEADENLGQTELVLVDRRRIVGRTIATTAESVTIAIAGVPTTFAMADIDVIRKLPPLEEQYERLRAATRDNDVDGLLRLAEWLRSRGRYTLALRELSAALAADPTNRAALEQRTLIEQQQRLAHISRWRAAERERERLARERQETGPDGVETQQAEPQAEALEGAGPRRIFPLLTSDQINLIRVFETDLADPPKMRIPRDVVMDFLDAYAGQPVEGRGTVPVSPDGRDLFARQRPVEILRWFFDLRAREFYPRVEVQENPRSLRLFRDTVHRTWLMNSCATSKCHGGEEAGRLFLYNRNPSRDESAITNLFILDSYRTNDGLPLVDYREPERSVLLQYGLPRNQAVTPHPPVEGVTRRWQPAFDGPQDRRFRDAVNWILSMYPNRTGYPIEYSPPVPGQLAGSEGGEAVKAAPR